MALTTSVNATMLVPSRLAVMLARDRLAPAWLGAVARTTGTPVVGLSLTFAAAAVLLLSGQVSLALNIAVFALVVLYFIHSLALLCLPRANPELFRSVTVRTSRRVQVAAAVLSLIAMGILIAEQAGGDVATLARLSLSQRIATHSLTTLELCALWAAIGAAIYGLGRWRGARERHDYAAALRATKST
jgi:basic amino acid/polyamine antiporter, APA family